MSALADVFCAVRLALDGTGFEAQATALATKAGKNAGQQMSANLSASLKSAARGAGGAALGLAFSAAANGALELNAATAEFTAQTGASDAEAKKFTATLAALNKVNVQSIPEISNTLIALKQHFDLTDEAAQKAAAAFLDFSRVAGTDAATAAGNFDELVDAGVITVGEMAATMDKLTYSHQRFGVPIQATIDALVKFAPAMNAIGMTTDQALGLMNLFTESGIDAAGATKAFNLALGKVKSPEELNRLMVDISATTDDFARSQKAADLFGNRAGRQLANALKPGADSIESFTPKLADYADATKRAGDALDSSFGNQAKLKLKEFNGTLAEMGTNMGDLLMVFALLGPGITRGLLVGLGGLAGLFATKIPAAIMAAIIPSTFAADVLGVTTGMAAGTAFGTALTAAAAAAAIAAPVVIILAAKGPVADFLGLSDMTGPAGPFGRAFKMPYTGPVVVPVELAPDEAASAEAFQKYLQDTKAKGLKGLDYSEWKKNAAAGGAAAGAAAGNTFAAGVKLTAKKESIDAAEVYALFGSSIGGVKAAAHATGIAGMEAMAAGITAARAKPVDAFTAMTEMLKNAMTPTQEAARLAGQLTSEEMAAGLRSKDPAVKAQAIAVRRTIIDRLEEITKDSGGIGGKAMEELDKGIRSKDPMIRNAAIAARTAVIDELNGTTTGARTAGANAGTAFVTGMLSRIPSFLRKAIEAQLHAAGVPGYATGAWEIPADQLAFVHRREMVIPAAEATAVRSGQAAVTAQGFLAGGPREQHINIEHVEIRDAHDEFSLTQSLRFLAAVQG